MGRQAACHVRFAAQAPRLTGERVLSCCRARAPSPVVAEAVLHRAYDFDPDKKGRAEAVQEAPAITAKSHAQPVLPGRGAAPAQARTSMLGSRADACSAAEIRNHIVEGWQGRLERRAGGHARRAAGDGGHLPAHLRDG